MFVVVTARFQFSTPCSSSAMSEEKSSISMSRKTRPKSGWLAKSPRPFPGTPRLAFCCETATRHMVRSSAIVSRRWRSRRSSLHRDRRGRTPMSSASSARSAANVSITSSFSMSVTCAVYCRRIFGITTTVGRISRLPRIVQSLGPYSRRLQAPLLPSHRSAVCTIATSVAQRKLFAVTEPAQPSRRRGSSRPAIASCECHSAPNRRLGLRSQQRSMLCSNDQEASAARFVGKPIPWPVELLSKDTP